MLDTNISVLLTTKCTLNCKYCSSGVPYYALPAHISSRRLLRQTERLLQIYQKAGIRVSHLDLIGGEPLLHPEIALIVRNLREQRPLFHELRILTNGSVWPPPVRLS